MARDILLYRISNRGGGRSNRQHLHVHGRLDTNSPKNHSTATFAGRIRAESGLDQKSSNKQPTPITDERRQQKRTVGMLTMPPSPLTSQVLLSDGVEQYYFCEIVNFISLEKSAPLLAVWPVTLNEKSPNAALLAASSTNVAS